MSNASKYSFLLRFAAVGGLLCLAGVSYNAGTIVASRQTPTVSVQIEDEAPLLISGTSVNSSSAPRQPRLDYLVTNVSGEPVNAFAVRHRVSHGNQYTEGVVLRNGAAAGSLLQAGYSEPAALEGDAYPQPVQSIELALDFVEFADGTTWGADKFKSAERLSGQRAGARAEAERLSALVSERGIDAVAQAVAVEQGVVAAPSGRLPEWIDGFREGVNFKRGRLRRAHIKSGLRGIEDELRRPFDTVVERRQR